MSLEKEFMSAETLSVLRDQFSPHFRVDRESLAPILNIFNKLKNTIPDETYRQVVGLLVQFDTSKTKEKLYKNILVENRLLHILREYDGLRFEFLDILNDMENNEDHPLNAEPNKWPTKESIYDEGIKEDNQRSACPSSNMRKIPMNTMEDIDEVSSLEFGLSRQMYQKVPMSLHHSNEEDGSVSDEMRNDNHFDTPAQEVFVTEHLDESTENVGVDDRSDNSDLTAAKLVSAKRGSRKRKAPNCDVSDGEGVGEISRGEKGESDTCFSRENTCKVKGSEVGGRIKKRSRRQGARENDMMLKQVGNHCILIGVKERAITGYNTQSEAEAIESEHVTSQDDDDDEERALVIVEEKPSSTSKKQKRRRPVKSSANLVKVSALCRAGTERCEMRRKAEKGKKEYGLNMKRGTSSSGRHSNINNNSCKSALEIAADEVLNTNLAKSKPRSDDSSYKMDRRKSYDERTVLDILNLADSQDCRSEKEANPDKSTNIKPLTSYLGLYPCGSHGNLLFPRQDNTELFLKSDKCASGFVNESAKSHQKSPSAAKKQFKSSRPKYNPNFPFSTTAFSAMSSIAETTTFEGSNYLQTEDSSQDEVHYNSGWDTASSQDSCSLERERLYGLGTFAQDDGDDMTFLNRLLRSPSPPGFGGNSDPSGRKRRHRHKPKRERKPKKPRRSRRLRGKHSREGNESTNDPHQNKDNGVTGRACNCCQ
ncbi:uncharacterized protein LOC121415869 [Lytechinus variegatus]|uniref:uncharacterized protein LOC121415869 n=1 Tax=Lytechinus variegatus TaxID=7654 RepID=UPI001BB135B8|nr:uncharacterized protein LOC121415869 [Lytechinus variegatus]